MNFLNSLGTRRRWWIAGCVIVTIVLGAAAAQVRPDYSIEIGFPTFDESRVDYEKFKDDFPGEDARALVLVEAPDLYTPEGLRRIAALETALRRIPGVIDTEGLSTVLDVTGTEDGVSVEPLFPSPDLPPAEIARRRITATTDPLFTWNLGPPDGRATVVKVNLDPKEAKTEVTRSRFLKRLRTVLDEHSAIAASAGATQKFTIAGIPIRRSQYTELVTRDLTRMFPIAFVLILVLLWFSFRRMAYVIAANVTILVSVTWTIGVMYFLDIPLQMLTQLTPIVVMIISISDTVHIVTQHREGVAAGRPPAQSAVRSAVENAMPCLLTEITIAGGFLALVANDMVMIQQFAIVTAIGMILTWIANVTVLPLMLASLGADKVKVKDRAQTRVGGAVARIEHLVTHRPRLVFACTSAIVLGCVFLASTVSDDYSQRSDFRPESQLTADLEYEDEVHGGSLPVAVHLHGDGSPGAMLDPKAVELLDRIGRRFEAELEGDVKTTLSLAKYIKKAHKILAGEEIAAEQPLPTSRSLLAKELVTIDDPSITRHLLSHDQSTAAVLTTMPDRGSDHAQRRLAEMRRIVAEETEGTGYQANVTGIFVLGDAIHQQLVSGLLTSLGLAVLLSFIVFCIVLRSFSLGAIALVPNVLPLLVTLGMMSLLGIALKPSTVILFSITLVIADDDTIQYMARFRRRFVALQKAGVPEAHKVAALATSRETGLPMVITTTAVSVGFLVLYFSEFLGLAHLGLLTAVSLFAAVFADLFLTPLLIIKLRPRVSTTR